MKNIYISIILIIVLLILINRNKEHFLELTDNAYKSTFLKNLSSFIGSEILNQDSIKISKVKNSSKLIIQNITISKYLNKPELFIRKLNYDMNKQQLNYSIIAGEHKTNILNSHYISDSINTNQDNINYGFLLEFNPDTEYNNNVEIGIDFYKNKETEIENIKKINDIINQPSYQELTRKSINIYSSLTAPQEFLSYFNKGDDNQEIELICVFYDQMNLQFIKSFPEGKFNILDETLNYILQECEIDKPFCGIGLDPKGKILGRDKYVAGRFNTELNKYVILDSPEYTEFKKKRKEKNNNDSKMIQNREINRILKELNTNKRSYYDLENHEITILRNNNKLQKYIDREIQKLDIKHKKRFLWTDFEPNEQLLVDQLGLKEKYIVPFKNDTNTNETFTSEIVYNSSTPTPTPSPSPNPSPSYNSTLFDSSLQTSESDDPNERYDLQSLIEYTDSLYSDMGKNFSNEVEGEFEEKYKYNEFENYKTCINKENYNKNYKNYLDKKFSVIHEDNEILTNGKDAIMKLKELNRFKCRKSNLDGDDRFYYGGLDLDNKLKCFGNNGECNLYKSENECEKMQDGMFGELSGRDSFATFTGNYVIEQFTGIGDHAATSSGSDPGDVSSTALEGDIIKEYEIDHTVTNIATNSEVIEETLGVSNKYLKSIDFSLEILFNSDNFISNHNPYVVFKFKTTNDTGENQNKSMYLYLNNSFGNIPYLYKGTISSLKAIRPDLNYDYLYKNKIYSDFIFYIYENKYIKSIKGTIKLTFSNEILNKKIVYTPIKGIRNSEIDMDYLLEILTKELDVENKKTILSEFITQLKEESRQSITDMYTPISSDLEGKIKLLQEQIAKAEYLDTERKEEEHQLLLQERENELKAKREREEQEAMRQRLISNRQKQISNYLAGDNNLVEIDPYDEYNVGFVGTDFVSDFQKYNSLDCIKNYKIEATCKHNIEGRIVDIITFKKSLVDLNPKEIITNNKILELNEKFLLEKPSEEDILKEKEIKYLIEPYNKNLKDINPGLIFNGLKYKVKIVNSYSFTDNIENIVSIVKIFENGKYLLTMKENNENTNIILKKNYKIHIFIDNKNKFNVAIFDNNLVLKSIFLSENKIEGNFGDELNLFLRHNNRKIFGGISQVEKLKQIVYPYNPFLNVKQV